jgi:Xaa-Pro aminopeptidase
MIPDDLVERLSRHAAFSKDREEIRSRLQRLIRTPSSRWRLDWIAALFPGAPEADISALRSLIDKVVPDAPRGFDPQRINALRAKLAELSLDAFIVPHADEHQGEFIPPRNRRLAWLTGFTGSAGTAVIALDQAWLFVDGRYMEQAAAEVDRSWIEIRHFQKPPIWEFVAEAVKPSGRVGYDPRLHATAELERIGQRLAPRTIALVPVDPNPIDALWQDRPPEAFSPIVPHPIELSGRSMEDKLAAIVEVLKTNKIDATLLNQLDSIAWLYNIRGGDIDNTPVAECFSLVFADGHADLFVEKEKLTPEAVRQLGNHVTIRRVSELQEILVQVGRRGMTVGLDPAKTTAWMNSTLAAAGASIKQLADPTSPLRNRKNEGELANLREAMIRDGACLALFLRWFHTRPADALPDELEIASAVTDFRAADAMFRGPSFATIVGIGANGAIVHYHPKPETNRKLEPGVLVLVDSGGQFLDGTTDITRTLIHGPASASQQRTYTTVLKSHIALGSAHFPKGTTGTQLDAIARAPLWRLGMNYDHGTGHGIGAFLGVHEGPVRIAPSGNLELEPGMLMSNEPGAYFPGHFGIRLENSVVVVAAGKGETGEQFLRFETLSLAPFERALIAPDLLSEEERAWLNDYHARVLALVGPRLSGDDAAWLEAATRPL